ncbi:hypothetical protein PLUTO_00500 [Luteibacter phage vB_LflM-Pluto]|uniref:Uncharacterized protein n=1 Tax=Luteibacter phage vB_LflM-Pluto TaxID=2948611 RepID=A0A9E7MT27_9CAUD|nr:hypothetical protein PLUTO_00500 [Luteibacter phage vB_LflM-Pluto]
MGASDYLSVLGDDNLFIGVARQKCVVRQTAECDIVAVRRLGVYVGQVISSGGPSGIGIQAIALRSLSSHGTSPECPNSDTHIP